LNGVRSQSTGNTSDNGPKSSIAPDALCGAGCLSTTVTFFIPQPSEGRSGYLVHLADSSNSILGQQISPRLVVLVTRSKHLLFDE
jgi:hypothetical protein